jgi:hypothetical protein
MESVLRGVARYILYFFVFFAVSGCSLPEGRKIHGVYVHKNNQLHYFIRLREDGYFDQLVCSGDESLFEGGGSWAMYIANRSHLVELNGYRSVDDEGRAVRSFGVVASEINWLPLRGVGFAFPFSDMGLYLPYRGEVVRWQCASL